MDWKKRDLKLKKSLLPASMKKLTMHLLNCDKFPPNVSEFEWSFSKRWGVAEMRVITRIFNNNFQF